MNAIVEYEYYCENSDCPNRQFSGSMKFYDDVNLKLFNNVYPKCPICSKEIKIHRERLW